MEKRFMALTLMMAMVLGIGSAQAADDPSIQGAQRSAIQATMQNFIAQNEIDGRFIIYDAVVGELKKLELEKLHEGIVKKGDFYVSCADFVDSEGNAYDIDFLVAGSEDPYVGVEAIVHSINKKKRPYHLED